MAADDRHYEIANRIRDIMADDSESGFAGGDIRVEDFPFTSEPSYGIQVSPIEEFEGVGTNERDDIGYVFQLTRVLHGLGSGGLESRSQWRTRSRLLFHRRRIGLDTGCELITKVQFGRIVIPKEWQNWNIDASVVRVTCIVRETR